MRVFNTGDTKSELKYMTKCMIVIFNMAPSLKSKRVICFYECSSILASIPGKFSCFIYDCILCGMGQEILAPDWSIASHVTLITSSGWLFT